MIYSLRSSNNNKRRSEASVETPESSEEGSRRRKKRAVFEDFEEIVPNVIGKSACMCYTIQCCRHTYLSFFNLVLQRVEISVDGTSINCS